MVLRSYSVTGMIRQLLAAFFCIVVTFPALAEIKQYEEAQYAIRTRNFEQAVKLFKELAADGHADSQYQLAAMYRTGRGVSKDHGKAAAWYRKAADQGHVNSQHNLGVMFEHGWGVDKDMQQARMWFEKADMQGHPMAHAKLKGMGDRDDSGSIARGDNENLSLEESCPPCNYRRRQSASPRSASSI